MELVYLWVEDYKNIKKQGFNFSPRFNCEFKDEYDEDGKLKDNCELVICDKNKKECEDNNYIENFFGDNINVTAIVGKNGSGKSSIFHLLEATQMGSWLPGYILYFRKDGVDYITSDIYNIIVIKDNKKTRVISDEVEEKEIYFEFLSYSSEIQYPCVDGKEIKYRNSLRMSFEQYKIFELVAKYIDSNIELTSFMYIPEIVDVRQNDELLGTYLESIRPDVVPRSSNSENGLPYEECHDERESYHTDNILEAFFLLRIMENEVSASHLCSAGFQNPKDNSFDISVLEACYNNAEYELNDEDYSLDEFNSIVWKHFHTVEDLSPPNIELLKKYSQFLVFNFQDKFGRSYVDLSHGEKSIFGQLLYIYDRLKNRNELCIILDEPDISLHPKWQKNYLNELMNLCQKFKNKIHIIFTTHSPFLLSDIPKQNIIFLDKDEEGNCKVVDGLKEKKQTFGANIHTLLSDSFFMEDGLMGEFAKGKIENVISFLREPKDNENIESNLESSPEIKTYQDAEKIISIIGEPILKMRLEKILDEYKIKQGIETEEDIQKKIDELNQKLRKIQNGQDKPE